MVIITVVARKRAISIKIKRCIEQTTGIIKCTIIIFDVRKRAIVCSNRTKYTTTCFSYMFYCCVQANREYTTLDRNVNSTSSVHLFHQLHYRYDSIFTCWYINHIQSWTSNVLPIMNDNFDSCFSIKCRSVLFLNYSESISTHKFLQHF